MDLQFRFRGILESRISIAVFSHISLLKSDAFPTRVQRPYLMQEGGAADGVDGVFGFGKGLNSITVYAGGGMAMTLPELERGGAKPASLLCSSLLAAVGLGFRG